MEEITCCEKHFKRLDLDRIIGYYPNLIGIKLQLQLLERMC